jgi:ABC-type nitrate/sulfonate/bicarbonate transport system permease component
MKPEFLTGGSPLQASDDTRPIGASLATVRFSQLKSGARRVAELLVAPALILVWQLLSAFGWINTNIFPPPSRIVQAIVDMAQAGLLWKDVQASVLRVSIGFALATIVGVGLGALLGRVQWLARLILPIIEIVRPISPIAWIPIAILWFGLGDKPAWFLICYGAFFPIFTNTYLGVISVQQIHVQAAQCHGASRTLFVRRVLLPSALPYILAGMRIGLGVAWMCVIAAELIAAQSGLGYMIQLARTMIETEKVFAGMIIIGILGFCMNALMSWLERQLTPWAAKH